MGFKRELDWLMRVVAKGVVAGESLTIFVGAFNFVPLVGTFIDFRLRFSLCGGFGLTVTAAFNRLGSWSFFGGVSSFSTFSSFCLTVDDLLALESIFIRSISLFGTAFYVFIASVYYYSFVCKVLFRLTKSTFDFLGWVDYYSLF